MSDIKFSPWIGAEYNKRNLLGKRILIIGESHYNEDGVYGSDLTEKCVNIFEIEREKINRTYQMIPPSFLFKESVNEISIEQRKWFWNSVALYNYIQEIVNDGPGGKRNQKQWQNAISPFYEVINKLQPELIFVFSVAVGNNLPRTNANNIDVNGLKAVEYMLENGGNAKLAVIKHPRSGLSYKEAHNTIKLMKEA